MDSFLAREATTSNPHYVYRQANAEELVEKRRSEAAQWGQLVGESVSYPGHPVGTDAQEVFEHLVAVWCSARATGAGPRL